MEGGTQYHNIAREIGKYRSAVSKIDELLILQVDPFLIISFAQGALQANI